MSTKLELIRQPIRELPSHIASLIAAGEIIGRPEDIVRELVENSVDAGATQIDISITQGGLEKIQVKDNGIGIFQEELPLALMHHATSKIKNIEDLEKLQTLGFRGEALASITAVACIELSSRVSDNTHGFTLLSKPEQALPTPKPIAHPKGTTVTITQLFHQVPARRRFLRAAATEFARIHSWIKYLSLSQPNIIFTLEHNKRCILKYTPTQSTNDPRLPRLSALYSPDFVKSAIFIETKAEDFKLTGWIGSPHFSRAQSDWQCFYINNRLIKDKSLNHAVKRAYQDVLYRDRQPAFALFLTLDASSVDVNVHPTKAEVRFHQPQSVYHFVYKSIQHALSQNKQSSKAPLYTLSPNVVAQKESYYPEIQTNHFSKDIYSDTKPFAKNDLETQKALSSIKPVPISNSDKAQKIPLQTCLEEVSNTAQPLGYALAQLHSTYILAQNDKGLVIVDAHAAHERILYETLKTSIEKKKPQIQQLLIPLTISLTVPEISLAKTHYALFQEMGFEYSQSKPETITLKAIPHMLSNMPLEDLLRDILSDLKEYEVSPRLEEKRNQFLATLACRSATRARRTMSLHEMTQLLRLIETTPHSGQCNHGRPTWREITLNELDTWFLRGR